MWCCCLKVSIVIVLAGKLVPSFFFLSLLSLKLEVDVDVSKHTELPFYATGFWDSENECWLLCYLCWRSFATSLLMSINFGTDGILIMFRCPYIDLKPAWSNLSFGIIHWISMVGFSSSISSWLGFQVKFHRMKCCCSLLPYLLPPSLLGVLLIKLTPLGYLFFCFVLKRDRAPG